MRLAATALIFGTSLALAACGESADQARDRGYSDGYASGYNTTCEIRSTLIAGDWDNRHYSEGYHLGYADGAADCLRSQRQ